MNWFDRAMQRLGMGIRREDDPEPKLILKVIKWPKGWEGAAALTQCIEHRVQQVTDLELEYHGLKDSTPQYSEIELIFSQDEKALVACMQSYRAWCEEQCFNINTVYHPHAQEREDLWDRGLSILAYLPSYDRKDVAKAWLIDDAVLYRLYQPSLCTGKNKTQDSTDLDYRLKLGCLVSSSEVTMHTARVLWAKQTRTDE